MGIEWGVEMGVVSLKPMTEWNRDDVIRVESERDDEFDDFDEEDFDDEFDDDFEEEDDDFDYGEPDLDENIGEENFQSSTFVASNN